MTDRIIEIVIPLAGMGGSDGAMACHVEAYHVSGATNEAASRDPAITQLKQVNLHQAGQHALDRVNTLRSTTSRWRLPRVTPKGSRSSRLRPLNTAQIRNISPEASSSAQLGLALGLLALERGDSRTSQLIVATGALSNKSVGDLSAYDTPVLPVDGLDQKFRAIGAWLEDHKPGPGSNRIDVFVPALTLDNEPVEQAHADDIAALKDRLSAIKTEVTIVPVTSLAEAATILGARKLPLDWKEPVAWGSIGIAAALGALAVTAGIPVPFQPAPVEFYLSDVPLETPLTQIREADAQIPIENCYGTDGVLELSGDQFLTVTYQTAPTIWPASLYDVTHVVIGRQSQAKVFMASNPSEQPLRTSDGRVQFSFGIAANHVTESEDMKLVTLARPLYNFNINSLLAKLGSAQQQAPGLALNYQANAMERIFGSSHTIDFRVVAPGEGAPCFRNW